MGADDFNLRVGFFWLLLLDLSEFQAQSEFFSSIPLRGDHTHMVGQIWTFVLGLSFETAQRLFIFFWPSFVIICFTNYLLFYFFISLIILRLNKTTPLCKWVVYWILRFCLLRSSQQSAQGFIWPKQKNLDSGFGKKRLWRRQKRVWKRKKATTY